MWKDFILKQYCLQTISYHITLGILSREHMDHFSNHCGSNSNIKQNDVVTWQRNNTLMQYDWIKHTAWYETFWKKYQSYSIDLNCTISKHQTRTRLTQSCAHSQVYCTPFRDAGEHLNLGNVREVSTRFCKICITSWVVFRTVQNISEIKLRLTISQHDLSMLWRSDATIPERNAPLVQLQLLQELGK